MSYLLLSFVMFRRHNYLSVIETSKSPQFYDGKEILVLQWIRPKADMGVHQLDILTTNSSDEGFKVLNVILWTDCNGPSSQNATAGYQERMFQVFALKFFH